MKKAKLLTTLGAVALIGAIGVGSTFAYLSASTGPVTNTFEIGNVSFDSDYGLKESTVARTNGTGAYEDTDGSDHWTTDHNEYENLHAGEVVLKDPTVTMGADSQDAWVFALVENDNAGKLSIQYNNNEWVDVTSEYKAIEGNEGLEAKYAVYAKKTTIAGGESSTIFNTVTVDDSVTGTTKFENIIIKACAVQAAGFASYEDAISEVAFN